MNLKLHNKLYLYPSLLIVIKEPVLENTGFYNIPLPRTFNPQLMSRNASISFSFSFLSKNLFGVIKYQKDKSPTRIKNISIRVQLSHLIRLYSCLFLSLICLRSGLEQKQSFSCFILSSSKIHVYCTPCEFNACQQSGIYHGVHNARCSCNKNTCSLLKHRMRVQYQLTPSFYHVGNHINSVSKKASGVRRRYQIFHKVNSLSI